jgi:dynactin-6
MATATASKRPSAPTTASTDLPKPPCTIHPTAIVAAKATIIGSYSISIGENSVLHPYSKLDASHGKVTIGNNTTIGEMAVVGGGTGDVEIGDGVEIGPGAALEGCTVGEGGVVEGKGKIGNGAVVGRFCRVSALNEVMPGEVLADYTVVYGNGQRRRNTTLAENEEVREAKLKGQELQVQLLKRLIPNSAAKWG